MFKDVIDSRILKRLVKIKQHSLPWMNSEIHKAMNKRYNLLKSCKWYIRNQALLGGI